MGEGENYGGANAWGGVTIDEQRGWVFAATGSATEDFYGGFRKGDNLFANTVLALDAMTGERKWHFQTVRHDIWDYDNPPAPILVTIGSGPTAKDAVVQLTKMGFTFVLDRDTGKPFPVQEIRCRARPCRARRRPDAARSAEAAAAGPAEPDGSRSHQHHARGARAGAEGLPPLPLRADLTPPSLQGTITTPGHLGGAEWHGASFDPVLNMLYVNVNEAPTINGSGRCTTGPARRGPRRARTPDLRPDLRRLPRRRAPGHAAAHAGARRPETHAAGDRDGHRQGRNAMPAFDSSARELSALAAFLKTPPATPGARPAARLRIATPSTATRCSSIRTACRRSRHRGAR